MINVKLRYIITSFGLAGIAALVFYGPIAQWASYHDFADKRVLCGVPNFLDVISNAAFLLAGLFILFNLKTFHSHNQYQKFLYMAMGISLASLFAGSVFYHVNPNNVRLVWDRLPIASFFSLLFLQIIFETKIITTNKINQKIAIVYWLLASSSVFFWFYSGDLRMYAFAQFFPLVSIILMIVLFAFDQANRQHAKLLAILIGGYGLAKIFESFDYELLVLTSGAASGHTLKHLTAGLGLLAYFMAKKKSIKTLS